MRRSLLINDRFYAGAKHLRGVFDARFKDPLQTPPERFVWDYWHVPEQYTVLRTPAYHYFSPADYRAFAERLVWWGRRTLGCHDISPPWLSVYVHGCRQELHADLPHGPFAFVYSLTDWAHRKFTGGETLLVREPVLDYWEQFVSERSVNRGELIDRVEPVFNRLTVFDPRIPHGVQQVEGTHDPRAGRLVIHGWFVQPRPFVEGPLATRELSGKLVAFNREIETLLADAPPLAGVLSLRFAVTSAGAVKNVKLLCDMTRTPEANESARRRAVASVVLNVKKLRFGKQRDASSVTLPLVFTR